MRETYTNNGNKEISDNPKLKKNEFYDRQFSDNVLPGEYFDIRENVLECDLNDDDKYAYDPGKENGSANAKEPLNDVKDLTNVVSTPTSSAIVESAGAIATSTATVVVGAAAAVVAFNATSKVQPKMVVNSIVAGSSFVHYDLELSNLELDKDYDIVIRNNRQEFKLDCVNGNNDEYVYDLIPGLQYSLSLVSYNELLGEIEYAKETFFTFNNEEIVGYSNIDIIYNDDLTCGISYTTKLVDDKNQLAEDTYIVIKTERGESIQDEDWELFDSRYYEQYSQDYDPDMYTYSYENKIHTGTIKEVPFGTVVIELHKMPAEEGNEGELIATTKKLVQYPLNIEDGANYVSFEGDYNLVKDIKKIGVKKDNLVARVSLFNRNGQETLVEKNIDINEGLFKSKFLVKEDTESYSYQVGYYKADKSFIVVKESEKIEFYGGYYGASYYAIDHYQYDQRINATWHYDENDFETVDLELLTEFDDFGNSDCFYDVELLKAGRNPQTGDATYTSIATIRSSNIEGNPIFKNLPVTEDDGSVIGYVFRFNSINNYYDETFGVKEVVMDTYFDDFTLAFPADVSLESGDFMLRGDGKFAKTLDMDYESSIIGYGTKFYSSTVRFHFFKENPNVYTNVVEATGSIIEKVGNYYYVVLDKEFPTGIVGYAVSYDISYLEPHGKNVRRAIVKADNPKLMSDVAYKINASLEDVVVDHVNNVVNGDLYLVTYMPPDATLRAKINSTGEYEMVQKENGQYVYHINDLSTGDYVFFAVFDKNGNIITAEEYGTYHFYANSSNYALDDGKMDYYRQDYDPNYHTIFTYNDDGTMNIYCNTGFTIADSSDYSVYSMNCYLQKFDSNTGQYVDVDSVTGITRSNPIVVFKNIEYDGYASLYSIRYDYVENRKPEYDMVKKKVAHINSPFLMGEDNVQTMNAHGQLMAYISYNDELEKDVITLTIPADMKFDLNQTITISGSFDGDDLTPVTMKLSDCLVEATSDGYYYIFDVYEEFTMGDAYVNIMYNYTLTNENYNTLVSNGYSGNLYNSYSLAATNV